MAKRIRKQSPDKTLEVILSLISRDVRIISESFVDTPLDAQNARKLTSYATTLANIREIKAEQQEGAIKELSRLDTQQLIDLYLKEKK